MNKEQFLKGFILSDFIDGDEISVKVEINIQDESYKIIPYRGFKGFEFDAFKHFGPLENFHSISRAYNRLDKHIVIAELLNKALKLVENELTIDK